MGVPQFSCFLFIFDYKELQPCLEHTVLLTQPLEGREYSWPTTLASGLLSLEIYT